MARLSSEKILLIQQLYSEIGIYSQVAKQVGCSPSTVKKYCNEGTPIAKEIIKFDGQVKPIEQCNRSLFLDNTRELTTLSQDEIIEIERLHKEI